MTFSSSFKKVIVRSMDFMNIASVAVMIVTTCRLNQLKKLTK